MMTSSEGPLFILASGPPTLNPPLAVGPICQPNELEHEIKHTTGRPNWWLAKNIGEMA